MWYTPLPDVTGVRARVHTNKHTIKRINSHCQIHTCSCGLAELKWLYFISLLLSMRESNCSLSSSSTSSSSYSRSFFLIFFFQFSVFCRLCCCINLSSDATTHFIHCMHLCLENFELFSHSHLISKWKLIIRNDFILFLFHSPHTKRVKKSFIFIFVYNFFFTSFFLFLFFNMFSLCTWVCVRIFFHPKI